MACRKAVPLDLAALLPSWELALRSERKSTATVKVYGDGVRAFLRWRDQHGHSPALDRELIKGFTADLLDAGAEATTARSRQLAMRRFSAWLAEEGEVDDDPLLGLKRPSSTPRSPTPSPTINAASSSRRAAARSSATAATTPSCG